MDKANTFRKFVAMVALVVLAGALSACASMGTLKPGEGTRLTVSGRSYDQVWDAALKVLSERMTIVETDREHGVIKAKHGMSLTSWGEVVGVYLQRAANGDVNVEVVSQKRSRLQITGPDWEETIPQALKDELGL